MSTMKTVLMCGCETGGGVWQEPKVVTPASSGVNANIAITRFENFTVSSLLYEAQFWGGARCRLMKTSSSCGRPAAAEPVLGRGSLCSRAPSVSRVGFFLPTAVHLGYSGVT